MFQVNDKVVCVDDSPGANDGSKSLVLHSTYCVDGFDGLGSKSHRDGIDGVFLCGVPAFTDFLGRVIGWNPARFRKVSEVQAENRLKRTNSEPARKP